MSALELRKLRIKGVKELLNITCLVSGRAQTGVPMWC